MRDVVGAGDLGDRVEDAGRMDLAVAAAPRGHAPACPRRSRCRRRIASAQAAVDGRAAGCPRPRPSPRAPGAGVARSSGLAAAVVDQLARIVGDADEAGVREDGRRAVAQLVVELAADDEDEVGLGHRGGAHGADDRRDGRTGRARGSPGCRDRRHRWRRAGAPAPAPAPRAPRPVMTSGRLRRPEASTAAAIGVGIGRRSRAAASAAASRRARALAAPCVAQHVGRDLDIDRPGLAQVAHGPRHRLVQLADHLVGDARACARCGSRAAGCRRAGCPAAAPC